MTDYLAEALDLIEHHVIPPETRAGLLLGASIAESLHALATTPPQGATVLAPSTARHDDTPESRPAEPFDGPFGEVPAVALTGPFAEPSLVALDRADEITSELRRWREADRIFPVDAAEWWDATLRLRDMIDRLGVTR